jgi:hypothetical protein
MAVCIPEISELDAMKRLVVAECTLASLWMAILLPTNEHTNPIYNPYGRDRFSLSVHRGSNTFLISKMPMALCGYMGKANFLIVLITVIVLIAIIATYSIKSKL